MNGKSARTKRRTARSQEKRPGQIKTPIRSISKRSVYQWVSLIFLIHAFGLVFLFAPQAGLFNSQPVIEQDWGHHFHHLKSLEAFWQQDKIFWGYNPLFMAGYPSNTIQDLSIKLFEFLALILSNVCPGSDPVV